MTLHNRRWLISLVQNANELADKLFQMTWCGCQAFGLEETCDPNGRPGVIWVNDSAGPDGAQEYAPCVWDAERGAYRQIESITVSWCVYDELLEFIEESLGKRECGVCGEHHMEKTEKCKYGRETLDWIGHDRFDGPSTHRGCRHCA